MIRELITEEISLVRMRIEFLRARGSHLSRDQFRTGWIAGYRIGRDEERRGRPDLTNVDTSRHHQVDVRGIEVDEGMRDLLVVLWDLGVETQFSCQGDVGKYVPHQSYLGDYAAQIVFADIDDGYWFLSKTVELLGHAAWADGCLTLTSMEPAWTDAIRAEVRFSPEILEEITGLWAQYQRAVPAASM